jgi:hypothetical protein
LKINALMGTLIARFTLQFTVPFAMRSPIATITRDWST